MLRRSFTVSLLAALALPVSATAAGSDVFLASSRPDGVRGSGASFQTSRSLSADGSRVAFHSVADNLLPADTDSIPDVFVKELPTGSVRLASTSASGVKGNDGSSSASLSAAGSIVAFESTATNLDPKDTDGLLDVYVRNLRTGALTLASTNAAGVKGNDHSSNPSLSADGTKVAFESRASNLDPGDTDHIADVYVKDLATGTLSLASRTAGGTKGNGFSTMPALSADGAVVAFESWSMNLDPADADALADVYAAAVGGGARLVSVTAAGAKGNDHSFARSISADGNRVAFHTASTNLDPADTDPNVADVYVKDRASGALLLASTSAAGAKAQSSPFFGSADASLSADGTTVAFESAATNLDPADTDSGYDIYGKDLPSGGLELLSTTAQSVKANADNGVAALAPDGMAAGFVSGATNLSQADSHPGPDVYVKQRAASCVDFSGSAPGSGPNPRRLAGFAVRVTSPSSAATHVRQERALRGLDVARRATVSLPLPARTVRATLARFAAPAAVTAYEADGSQAGSTTMTGPQASLETLTLHGNDIQRLRLSAPQQEALLVRVCLEPICTITGTNGPDSIAGSPAADVICARAGDDGVHALGGDDRVYGGRGRDRVQGGTGADRLFGAAGRDGLRAGAGADRLFGGRGQDGLVGAQGPDRLRGGHGNDRLDGGPKKDRCVGGPGTDGAVACEIVTGVP